MSVIDEVRRTIDARPDHVAIQTPEAMLSYGDVGRLADRLADLLESGVPPGGFVGVEGTRRAGSVVGMLAALWAGRPFVTLDPRDNAASNRAKVSALAVDRWLTSVAGPDVVDLSSVPPEWRSTGPAAPPPRELLKGGAADLGYAIYTSGSTGEPKCVLVPAAPLVPVIADHVRRLEVGPDSRTLQFARLTFDGCITEILWTLTAGARLVVLDESWLAPGPVLAATLEHFGITHLKTTPYALTATRPTSGMVLRHVVNGGGTCRPAVVAAWSAVATFHNAYGTTETTICNLLSDGLTPAACRDGVPLGEVVGDCTVALAPIGRGAAEGDADLERGELVVTGRSVAAGYLTAEGLAPFQDVAGRAAYHTGDVVERRGGALYFVERVDRQVKVRGFRIDPGEVEAAACRLGTVTEAVVTAESHDSDGTAEALICYYLGDADPRDLRRHLVAVLDPYKVPSVLIRLDRLPYTPNGKVDRDALRAGRATGPTAESRPAEIQPAEMGGAGKAERQVLDVVRRLTGFPDVSLEDNFFDIGGDSASTVVLVEALKRLGWTGAGVRDVLRADTLGELVARVPVPEG
ncbi:MAG TPA: non-ribosomal peptide synthetase [Kineosporiaceae bacterium]